jgi:hypothetical protein
LAAGWGFIHFTASSAEVKKGGATSLPLGPLHALMAWIWTNLYIQEGTNNNLLKSAENSGYLKTNSNLLQLTFWRRNYFF